MRHIVAAAAIACAHPALADSIPVRGQSTLAQLSAAPGLEVELAARFGPTQAALALEVADDGLRLRSPSCEIEFGDRDGDGRYESVQAREAGVFAPTCRGGAARGTPAPLEAGRGVDLLEDCLISVTPDLTVQCQPTRFGRADGEAWTVLDGFADAFRRSARGAPTALGWSDGLLVVDAPSGAIYRVSTAQPVEAEVEVPDSTAETVAATPLRPTRSRLIDLPVSETRQAVLDKRAAIRGRDAGD